jgi:hypothetical protein
MGIDRPAKLNGFSPKMIEELGEAYVALINEGNRLPLGDALATENATARASNSARGSDQLGVKKRHRPPGS